MKYIKSRPKIAIIGAGNVGGTCAVKIAEKGLGDIVLVDIRKDFTQGKALDLWQSGPVDGFNLNIRGTDQYDDTENSDIIIITAGSPRTPEMSRDDLLAGNKKIIEKIVQEVSVRSPQAILIMVSNPLDVMTYLAWKISKFPINRVMGQAGVLDASRFETLVAQELMVSPGDVQAQVLGSHGDEMLILPRLCSVRGIPLTDLLPKEAVAEMIEKTRRGGAEIVKLFGSGSAYVAPAASVTKMAESIIRDQKKIMSCSVYLQGEWGLKDIFIGVPVTLGGIGVEKIWDFSNRLYLEEYRQFLKAAETIKKNIAKLEEL